MKHRPPRKTDVTALSVGPVLEQLYRDAFTGTLQLHLRRGKVKRVAVRTAERLTASRFVTILGN